jgi:hypothetical protein
MPPGQSCPRVWLAYNVWCRYFQPVFRSQPAGRPDAARDAPGPRLGKVTELAMAGDALRGSDGKHSVSLSLADHRSQGLGARPGTRPTAETAES